MNLTPAECYLRADAHLYVGYLFMRNHEEHHAATVLSRAVELFDLLFRAHPSVDDYRIAGPRFSGAGPPADGAGAARRGNAISRAVDDATPG